MKKIKNQTYLYENAKRIFVQITIPGVKKEDIQIIKTFSGIGISVEKINETDVGDLENGVHSSEKKYMKFFKEISLPQNIDLRKATAKYKDGMLTIQIPKREDLYVQS